MRKHISKYLLLTCILFPCLALAQGNTPDWVDSGWRSGEYPQGEYYTGFAVVSVTATEGFEKAVNRAKQSAIGELSDRVRVLVSSEKKLADVSISGSDMEERFRSLFQSEVRTSSQAEVVGSKVKTYYNERKREVYAFAYVSRTELAAYYRKQISLYLNKVDGTLASASELAEKGIKIKARKQCEEAIQYFVTVAYAQDLLTAIDTQADDAILQQIRSERLRNRLIQTIIDLENSIYVYVECKEIVDGEKVVYIADKLPALLTSNDCGCNFTTDKDQADYVIKVDVYLDRCNDAGGGTVFCWADATVSIFNTYTQKTLKPKIDEAKGGWTNKNYVKAGEEAFDELAKKIAEKVIPLIKN
jgi:hypothetical protein